MADPGIFDARDQHFKLDLEVPQIPHLHFAERGHVLAVGPDTGEDRILGGGFAEAVVATCDHDARRKTLEVPLPGRREGLIEIVDGEDESPLWGGETPEVDQVGVSAALHADAGGRSARQIIRHGERRAPVEGEGRLHHAPVAKGKEIGESPRIGLQHQADGVRPVVRRLPCGVRIARTLVPQCLAHCQPLSSRRMGHQSRVRVVDVFLGLCCLKLCCVRHPGLPFLALQAS